MVIAFLADAEMKKEILAKGLHKDIEVTWADTLKSLTIVEADAYFDLKFDDDKQRIHHLASLLPKPVFISAHNQTLNTIGDHRFIRINAWPGMINRNLSELAFEGSRLQIVDQTMHSIGWDYLATPDIPGFVTSRIIATIINEAYFALGEGVSSKTDIDLAMKAGTNYPYGPFEWAARIGHDHILTLLQSMYLENKRYEPAPLLFSEFSAR